MPTKVLYVEDELFLAKIVMESLESRGYDVRWINDGKDVIDAYGSYRPDVCVLDVMLPNKDGFTLGEEIRALDPAIPIIFLTAKSQTKDVLNGFSSGGNDYLKKPFSMEELIARIDNLLNMISGHSEVQEQYAFGKFTYDPLRMELVANGEISKLSHRENELLHLLVQHRNKPIERRLILKQLWGDDSFFNSRNLDVYITRLAEVPEKQTLQCTSIH